MEQNFEHVTVDLLVRHLDEELTPAEALAVSRHLTVCSACSEEFAKLREESVALDEIFLEERLSYQQSERERLLLAIGDCEREAAAEVARRSSTTKSRRETWFAGLAAAAMAASLAVGIFLLNTGGRSAVSTGGPSPNAMFEVDGEKFWALPYSNPELPVGSPRVVQMQVPIESLADAGIVLEPVASREAAPDRAVLADVLLGLDGQPLGVHVLSVD